MVVLAALVMRGPANVVGPMAPVVREVFGLSWDAFGVLAGIPTMAFGLCSLEALPLVARLGSRTFAVLALAGVVLGSFVRCAEWVPALFIGTLILSVSIAGLNVWVPSVVKVVFPDRQSQVMGVYTAVLGIGGLLGILLGRGRQNVIFKLRAVRGLKDEPFQRVFFFFLLGLQGRAGAGQTAGKTLPCQQQPRRAQRAGQQRNAAQR